jgi:hypothetical protein
VLDEFIITMSMSFHVVWFDPIHCLDQQRVCVCVLASRRNNGAAVCWSSKVNHSPIEKTQFLLLLC